MIHNIDLNYLFFQNNLNRYIIFFHDNRFEINFVRLNYSPVEDELNLREE